VTTTERYENARFDISTLLVQNTNTTFIKGDTLCFLSQLLKNLTNLKMKI